MSQIYEARIENGEVVAWKRTGCTSLEEWLSPDTVEPSDEINIDGADVWTWEENGKRRFVATRKRED